MALLPPVRAALRGRWTADAVAGLSVAFVLVPQSMAYAELAGLPAHTGLVAGAFPCIVAALFASSPYLQTGPGAVTSLMTFGALTSLSFPGTPEYVMLASILALVVGVVRTAIGLFRGGPISYLMSQPVLRGFIAAAALLIVANQIPATLGIEVLGTGGLMEAFRSVKHPAAWDLEAAGLGAATLLLMLGGRRIHPLFPGVLLAVLAGVVYSRLVGYEGPTLGTVPSTLFLEHSYDLPISKLPRLFMSGTIIALVGFAEAASLSQTFAEQTRQPWDPDREFLSQGLANLTSGLAGAFPVGGSFARTAINRLAGARTRWSGAFAGGAVLVFLPFAWVLQPLPKAVLGAIVIGAVSGLLRPAPLVEMWEKARLQAAVGIATSIMTLALSPHVEYAVVGGVAMALAVHVWREMKVVVTARELDGVLILRPMGVIWFGSAPMFRRALAQELAAHEKVRNVLVDLSAVGRIDLTGALALRDVVKNAAEVGIDVGFCFVPSHAERIMDRVCGGVTHTHERAEEVAAALARGLVPPAPRDPDTPAARDS